MKHPFALVLLVLAISTGCNASRILCFFPVPVRSVVVFAQQLMVKLAENGHQVTMVSPFALDLEVANYRDVVIPVEPGRHAMDALSVNQRHQKNIFLHINEVVDEMIQAANTTMWHPDFRQLMEDEQFDLIVMNFVFATFQHGLAAHFRCPYILLSNAPVSVYFTEMIGQPINPEAVPSFFTGYTEPMNLWMRVKNMAAVIAEYTLIRIFDARNGALYR